MRWTNNKTKGMWKEIAPFKQHSSPSYSMFIKQKFVSKLRCFNCLNKIKDRRRVTCGSRECIIQHRLNQSRFYPFSSDTRLIFYLLEIQNYMCPYCDKKINIKVNVNNAWFF